MGLTVWGLRGGWSRAGGEAATSIGHSAPGMVDHNHLCLMSSFSAPFLSLSKGPPRRGEHVRYVRFDFLQQFWRRTRSTGFARSDLHGVWRVGTLSGTAREGTWRRAEERRALILKGLATNRASGSQIQGWSDPASASTTSDLTKSPCMSTQSIITCAPRIDDRLLPEIGVGDDPCVKPTSQSSRWKLALHRPGQLSARPQQMWAAARTKYEEDGLDWARLVTTGCLEAWNGISPVPQRLAVTGSDHKDATIKWKQAP